MPWALRGLRNGIVTTDYPKRPDAYADGFPSAIDVGPDASAGDLGDVCPTGAIGIDADRPRVDRGRCILCGECVRSFPNTFRWTRGSETAAHMRESLILPADMDDSDAALAQTKAALAERVRRLRRSVHVRHVDAGSDGSEEWEIQALTNPTYDVHRLGIFFTASPRHADILLVTGAGAHGMIGPLRRTQMGMPNPIVVIAVGTDAISGGMVGATYATTGGILQDVAADILVPGSPPPPFAILHAILLALGRAPESNRSSSRSLR